MEKVKILWSGITGRTGTCALKAPENGTISEIVAGVCRNNEKYYNYDELNNITEPFDIIVDFSHKDSFDKVLNFALKVNKPIIIGTAGLDENQEKAINDASKIIPIFKGGNFRFNVKTFIDKIVDYAKTCDHELVLTETHYKTKKVPSETAKVIAKRVFDETGKVVNINSFLEYDELINDWKLDHLHCRCCGFDELGSYVLQIAQMMIGKPAGKIYDLDRLFKEENKK